MHVAWPCTGVVRVRCLARGHTVCIRLISLLGGGSLCILLSWNVWQAELAGSDRETLQCKVGQEFRLSGQGPRSPMTVSLLCSCLEFCCRSSIIALDHWVPNGSPTSLLNRSVCKTCQTESGFQELFATLCSWVCDKCMSVSLQACRSKLQSMVCVQPMPGSWHLKLPTFSCRFFDSKTIGEVTSPQNSFRNQLPIILLFSCLIIPIFTIHLPRPILAFQIWSSAYPGKSTVAAEPLHRVSGTSRC